MRVLVTIVPPEEKERFDVKYEGYGRHVPRYIPGVIWESQKGA